MRPVSEQEWQQVVSHSRSATFFHTPLWSSVVTRTFPAWRSGTVGRTLGSGARVILPIVERAARAPRLRLRLSTFAGCYGGLITDGPLSAADMQELSAAIRKWQGGRLRITGNPLGAPEELWSGYTLSRDSTYMLPLASDYETLHAGFSRGHRSGINRARRLGVVVRPATSLEEYRAYFGAYQDSLRRWGDAATSRYPLRLFENCYHLSREHPRHITLWLAIVDNEVAGGALVFYWNEHAVYWHGASHARYFDAQPNTLLHAEVIRDAVERGYRYYDFNPSGEHEGVAEFKRRFGAEKHEFSRWRYDSRLARIARQIRARLHGSR